MAEIAYLLSPWMVISVCLMTHGERVTYRPILGTNRLAHFHHGLMRIDGYGVSGSSYVVRVQSQLGLGSEGLVTTKQEHI